jgi:FAD/FMN-containing dehydrogenase
MESLYNAWRLRFVVAGALLLAAAAGIGFAYFDALRREIPPCQPPEDKRWCVLASPRPAHCPTDDPCLTDTIDEHRWSGAHQQALLHGLLLLGLAAAVPYLRIGRPLMNTAGWLLILGCWGAPLGATVQAWTMSAQGPPVACWPTGGGVLPAWECLGVTIGTFAGPITGVALLIFGGRSAWEVLRSGIAPPSWRNWLRTVRARPRRIVEPASAAELRQAVQQALDAHMTVRAVGAGYSWSPIAPPDGMLVDVRRLRRIDGPMPVRPGDSLAQPGAQIVQVEAGATIREVTEYLAALAPSLMLPNSPVNPWVQVGGALALGCHGTGTHVPQFFELATEIEIVQYDANRNAVLRTYQRPLAPPGLNNVAQWHEWNALAVSLGSLGVIYRVKLECVPSYAVHMHDARVDMEATLRSPAALAAIVNGGFSEIFWFPFNREAFVRTWLPSGAGAPAPLPRLPRWYLFLQWLAARVIGPLAFAILAVLPFLTPAFLRLFHRVFSRVDFHVPAQEAMQYERAFHTVLDVGYAIPIDPNPAAPDFRELQGAWFEVVDRLATARHRAVYPQNLVIHTRFGRGSSAYLASNGGAGHYAFIEVITHASTGQHEEHFSAIERDWLARGGRAHWAKMSFCPERILDNYPQAAQFRLVRAQMDPDGVFLNDYVRSLLRL